MKNMLYKEFRLAMHPTAFLFMALAVMMLIPNYPYYVTFFYMTLAIFFICLGGRENHDIFYTMTLPVAKSSVVSARFIMAVILEITQIILALPFAILRSTFKSVPPNQAGMDANAAMFGISFVLLGLFNFVFFTKYYKDPDKVGKAFAVSSIIYFAAMLIAEACSFAIPFVHEHIDNTLSADMPYRLVILAAGIVIYAVLTLVSYKKSVKSFCALDL
ncbi:MAG: ABC-2 transporter permease [Oscillospiraceae bacterium]|nr:ABC-2 transporter permease [Oscillospiraceae bacterium]